MSSDKVVLVTGGDSGIGRATVVAAAKEGGRIAFAYLNEEEDARETERLVEQWRSVLFAGRRRGRRAFLPRFRGTSLSTIRQNRRAR